MCECLRREDGTWHVDECCAHVMDNWHGMGILPLHNSVATRITEECQSLMNTGIAKNRKKGALYRAGIGELHYRLTGKHLDEVGKQEVPF